MSNSASFSELQYFASRHAAAIAAVAAVALPPPPSSSTSQQGTSSAGPAGSAASSVCPGPPPPPHQHDFHPAYRIPGYMEHLYSLQHATAAPGSAALHGNIITRQYLFFIFKREFKQIDRNHYILNVEVECP